jgi:two-component system, NarL family, nitrate/nitrite response regulator NarL
MMPSMPTTMTRTLLIVDDHSSFRSFVRGLLDAEGFAVTGEAEDGESALVEVERLHPDVVLLDVQLPGIDGFEVARRLAAEPGGPKVVLTSSRDASDYGTRLEDTPASGFIPKRELSGEALAALVASG